MPKIYKRNCDNCGNYYCGTGRNFCSRFCATNYPENKERARKRVDGICPKITDEQRRMGNLKRTGAKRTIETRNKISIAHLGKKASVETRKKQSLAHRGEKTWSWRGGISPINKIIRHSLEYRVWRESVFKRDNWTCRFCFSRGVRLHADHIKPFSFFPELRFDIENGRTLCEECHKKTETYGARVYLWRKDSRYQLTNTRTELI
jgi:hypothetical protein